MVICAEWRATGINIRTTAFVDIVNKICHFADDTKIAAVVSDKDGVDQLQAVGLKDDWPTGQCGQPVVPALTCRPEDGAMSPSMPRV